jgi:hypothetical protein
MSSPENVSTGKIIQYLISKAKSLKAKIPLKFNNNN